MGDISKQYGLIFAGDVLHLGVEYIFRFEICIGIIDSDDFDLIIS